MADCIVIREPEVVRHGRRWAVEWALFDRDTLRSFTRTKRFMTRRRAERWIESKRVKPTDPTKESK